MDFQLLADVWQRGGEKLGELRHVVCDPSGLQVTALVVQQAGMRGRAVLLPANNIVGTEPDGEVTYTDLPPEQFDRLERYAYGENIAPPPADVDPIDNQSADFDEEIVDIPDVAPVGAAEGITTIAYTPLIDVVWNVPEGAVIIDDGTEVQATDGVVGKVKHVLTTDDTKRVRGFIVERGHIFTHDQEVPTDWVTAVTGDVIALNVDKSTVEATEGDD